MKNKILGIFLVLFILLISLSGFIYFYRAKLIGHYLPHVEQIGDLEIKVEQDTSYIRSKLVITNNSFLKIGVDTLKYKVSVFDKIYLNSRNFIGLELPANGSDTIDFFLKIPYRRIIKDIREERKKSDSASYSIQVSLQYSTFLGRAELPISKESKLKIPQPPELEVVEIKYQKVRLKLIHAVAKIKIINYGPITLSIKEMTYSMLVDKQGDLKGKFKYPITIKPYGTTMVSLPIKITLKNSLKTAFQVMMNNDTYDYRLELNAILAPTDQNKKPFRIHLTKNGKMELKK